MCAAAVVLTGCGGSAPEKPTAKTAAGHNAADVTFLQDMIPHHQQALELSAMVPDHTGNADLIALAKQINRIDLYTQAASQLKVNVPKDALRSSKLMDGVVWDGKDPKKYADGFKIKA